MLMRLVAQDEGHDILVDGTLVVVGRHPKCDVRIVSLRVSRWHCCIMELDGGVVVLDLGSTNGTWINGRRVERGVLHLGDELSIAHFRYHLEIRRAE